MKMMETIADSMFAPCGMNCQVCYKHCAKQKLCPGCRDGDPEKPGHCRTCKIKDCALARQLTHCFECPDFPCPFIKSLEKSYQTRYRTSLIQNSLTVKEAGLEAFMRQQREEYTCPGCGGIISLHDGECSECGRQRG